jgi:hypothetical protein
MVFWRIGSNEETPDWQDPQNKAQMIHLLSTISLHPMNIMLKGHSKHLFEERS